MALERGPGHRASNPTVPDAGHEFSHARVADSERIDDTGQTEEVQGTTLSQLLLSGSLAPDLQDRIRVPNVADEDALVDTDVA